MKTRSTVLAMVLTALVLSGCSTAKPSTDPVQPTGQQSAATTEAAVNSDLPYELQSEKLGFVAKFPDKPKESTQDTSQGGQSITVNSFQTSSEENYYGLVSFSSPCTPEGDDIANRLKASATGSINGAAKSAGETAPKITSQKSTTLSGKPALETKFTITKGGQTAPISTVVVLDGSRFYTLLLINSTSEKWEDFVSTFNITNHPPASPACPAIAG